jgi:hypothetical protein
MIASKSDTVALQIAVEIVKGRAGNFVGSEAGIELILAILPDIIWNDAPHYIGLDQHRFEVLGRDRICNLADLVKVGDTRQIQAVLIRALSGAKTCESSTPLVASYLDEYLTGTQSALVALSCIKIAKSCDTTIGLVRHGIIESVNTIVKTGHKRSGRRRQSVGWADIVVAEASSLLESWVYEKFEIPRDPSMMTLFEFTSSGCLDQLVKSQKVNACMHHVVSVIEKEIACMHRRDWKSLPSEELWKQYMENRSFTIMLSLPATTGLQRIILGIDPHMTIGSVEKFVAARIAGKEEDEEDTDEAGSTRSVTPQTLPMDDRKTIITYNGKHFDMNATLLEIVVGDYNPMKSSTRKIPDLPNIGDVLSLTSPCTEDNVDHELLDHIWSSKPHEFVVEYSSSSSSEMVVKKCIDFPTGSIVETMETPSSGTLLSISSNLRLALEALAIRRSSHEPIDIVSRKINELFSMVLKSSMGTKKFPYYMEIVEMHAPEILNSSVKEKLLHAKYFNTTSRSNIRQKIKLNRSEILGSAIAVMNMFAANRMGILEMEFQGEIGTGSGPTNEFYTLVADELKSSSQCLFRRTVDDCLFPAPMDVSDEEYHEFVHRHTAHVGLVNCRDGTINVSGETDSERLLILSRWRLAGQILGRALFDGRLIDLEFSPVFWILVKQIIFQNRVAVTESYMRFIDPVLLNSLDAMMDMSNGDLAELDIDTLPGYSVKLGFDEGSVLSKENAGEYRRRVIDTTLVGGVLKQVHAFATGLESVVGKETIALLTDQDWSSIVTGGARDDNVWSIESLRSALHAQNGYTAESPQICHLIEVLAEFDLKDRELFVKFLTGSKSLPSGGFSSLKPPLTVVKAVRSPDEGPVDMFLPSVMTCANFIKLPEYSTKLILKNQLIKAIHEGQGSFLLS